MTKFLKKCLIPIVYPLFAIIGYGEYRLSRRANTSTFHYRLDGVLVKITYKRQNTKEKYFDVFNVSVNGTNIPYWTHGDNVLITLENDWCITRYVTLDTTKIDAVKEEGVLRG